MITHKTFKTAIHIFLRAEPYYRTTENSERRFLLSMVSLVINSCVSITDQIFFITGSGNWQVRLEVRGKARSITCTGKD
jgi:hypothetical protein